MKRLDDIVVLVGILSIGAAGCESKVGSDDAGGNEGGSGNTEGANKDVSLEEGCLSYVENAIGCEGDEDEGSDGGVSGDYGEDYAARYCAMVESELQNSYGDPEGCGEAFAQYFACLGALDCAALEESRPCPDVYKAGRERCPEGFSFCNDSGSSGGSMGCTYNGNDCVDDREYMLSCTGQNDTTTCTCSIDGTTTGSFTPTTNSATCGGKDLNPQLTADCGWPDNFFL